MGDLLRVFPLLTSKNEKKIADKQTMNNSPKVPGNALDVSETENIFLAFLFQGFFSFFGSNNWQWASPNHCLQHTHSTHSVQIVKSLTKWSKETFKVGQKRQRLTKRVYVGVEGKDSKYKEGHCSAGRFDSSLENNRVDFLAMGEGGCLKSEVTKFTGLPLSCTFYLSLFIFFTKIPASVLMSPHHILACSLLKDSRT